MKQLILFLLPLLLLSQEKSQSKMDMFLSGSGKILRLENYDISGPMSARDKYIEATVRRAVAGKEEMYFLLLSHETGGSYSKTVSASIAEDDLRELVASLPVLKSQANKESGSYSYLENKYITDDGFQVGYFLGEDQEAVLWFITLEKYGDSTFLFRDSEQLDMVFSEAQTKIKELKGK